MTPDFANRRVLQRRLGSIHLGNAAVAGVGCELPRFLPYLEEGQIPQHLLPSFENSCSSLKPQVRGAVVYFPWQLGNLHLSV